MRSKLIVPLNTKKVYVRAICKSGCEVYFPVDSYNDEVIASRKASFQEYLDNQPFTQPPLMLA